MNLIPAINFIANAVWLSVFTLNSLPGFIFGQIIMTAILVTDLYLMMVAGRNHVWWFEVIAVRIPFSLYSGWITSASIVSMEFLLKAQGMHGEDAWNKPIVPPTTDWLK